jgi:hypothetical protein
MRLLRILAVSLPTGLWLQSACFTAPENRDFGISSKAGSSGRSNDASVDGSGGAGGGGSGASGASGTGGSGAARPDGSAGGTSDAGSCQVDGDCDDRDRCSGTEKCVAGTCQAGTALANKTNCTLTERSVPEGGLDSGGSTLIIVPGACYEGQCLKKCDETSDCDDENPCTGQEACDGLRGVCVPGIPPSCDDADDCTQDGCDPDSGACVNQLIDKDDDGHAASSLGACGDDCDDDDETIYTGAAELCDAKDNDCNGTDDDNTPFWYVDCDSDGFSASTQNSVQQCAAPAGGPPVCGGAGKWTAVAPVSAATQDCNDAVAAAHPGNEETCDGVDNDCNGVNDDVLPKKWADCDGDGYARANAPAIFSCVHEAGPPTACPTGSWTSNEPVEGSIDCRDTDAAYSPAQSEDCAAPDGIDQNCDGVVDGYRWFKDCDGDGYAAPSATSSPASSCNTPATATGCSGSGSKWVRNYPSGQRADCDDGNAAVYPYASYKSSEDRTWGYDYNCDKQVSKQYTTTGVSTTASCVMSSGFFLTCVGADGWTGSTVPECGQTAQLSLCNCISGGFLFCESCARQVTNAAAQGCR